MARYDAGYIDNMNNFRDPDCKHQNIQQYNARGSSKKITAIQSVCIRCGRISAWAKTSKHTLGGGFEYTVQFPTQERGGKA